MSITEVGQVSTGTVTFTRATTTSISVGAPAIEDGVTIADITAGGILIYRPDLCSEIAVANGSIIRGIRAVDTNGDAVDPTTIDARKKPMLMIRAEDGGSATVRHEDGTVPTAEERTTTAYGVDITIGADSIQCFWSMNAGSRRWRCPHWSVFFATTPADWAVVPGTTGAAINQLAAAFAAIHGPVP